MHDLIVGGRIFLYFAIASVALALSMIFFEKRKSAAQVVYEIGPLSAISFLTWIVYAGHVGNWIAVSLYAGWFAFSYLVMRPLLKPYL